MAQAQQQWLWAGHALRHVAAAASRPCRSAGASVGMVATPLVAHVLLRLHAQPAQWEARGNHRGRNECSLWNAKP